MGIGTPKPSTTIQAIIKRLLDYYSRSDFLQERNRVLHFYLLGDCSTDINYRLRQPLQNQNNEIGAINKFIDSKHQSLVLLLGDAGVGKTVYTQWLVNYFCQNSKDETYPGFVPIRIELKAYNIESIKDAINHELKNQFNFSEQEIAELKQLPDVVFLLDGYDEIAGYSKINIYKENQCLKNWPKAKVLITCRNGHFKDEAECRELFDIPALKYAHQADTSYADVLYLAPFDEKQIEGYLDEFVKSSANSSLSTSDINHAKSLIKEHENLKAVVQNPFVLQIFAETFPNLLKKYGSDINKIVLSDVYEQFLDDWFIHAKERLKESINLSEISKKVTDLKGCFYKYAQAFAYALFAGGEVEIVYTPKDSHDEFEIQEYTGHKAFEHFFKSVDPNPDTQKLLDVKRAACPLRRNIKAVDDVYSFIHKSYQDYLAANYLFTLVYDRYRSIKEQHQHNINKNIIKDILDDPNHVNHKKLLDVLNVLNKRYLTEDRLVLRFLSERLEKLPFEEFESLSEEFFLSMIQYSAKDKSYCKAASSIISTLCAARKCMSGWDLRGVSIPKADLSRAILHRTNFTKADLIDVKFNQAYMAEANLSYSQMKDVQFGELPYFMFNENVDCLSFGIDGKTLVVGQGKKIVISDVITGKQVQVLQGHHEEVTSVAISADSSIMASGSKDYSVRLWDSKSGKVLQVLQGHRGSVNSVALSGDGTTVVSGSEDSSVRLWDSKSSKVLQVLQGHRGSVNSVALSGDGTTVVSGSEDSSVRLWDSKSGKVLQVLQGHRGSVNSVALSGDGTTVVSGSKDNSVRLWDVKSGKELQVLRGHIGSVNSVALSRDGTTVVSGSFDDSVRLWDVKSGKELKVLQGHSSRITSIALSADGTIVVSGSDDKSVRLWEAKSDKVLRVMHGHSNWIPSVALSADVTFVASVSYENNVRLWDSKSGKLLQVLQGHNDIVECVALSSDGTTVASGSKDTSVRLWEVKSGKVLTVLLGHSNRIHNVAFSADGTIVASGSWDESVRLWDVKSGKELQVLRGHSSRITSVALSADGTIVVSGSDDKSVRLWEAKSGKELKVLQGHSDRVYSIAFSADGTVVASGSWDKSVRLWDVKSGKELKVLWGHSNWVYSVTFSADDILASGSYDKTIRIWDIVSYQCIAIIANGAPVLSVSFNKQGRLVTGDGAPNNAVRLWQLINHQWQLKWSIPQQSLYMTGCIIEGVKDLSNQDRHLIEQRSSEIKLLEGNLTQTLPVIIDDQQEKNVHPVLQKGQTPIIEPISSPLMENLSTENDKKDKLIELLFNGILKKLFEKNLKILSPKIFLVYAHDNSKFPEKLADSEIAKLLINWLQKDLSLNVYSDITPYGNQDYPKTVSDIQRKTDILKSQLCLLSKTENSVDVIIFCGSELLKAYCDSKKYKDYYTALNNALNRGNPGAEYASVQGIVNQYSREQDFHHVLTELVFLNKRILDEGQQTVIPVMLNGKSFRDAFPHFVSGIDVYIEKTKYRERKLWNNKEVYKNEGLYLGFFDLLERLFEGKEILKEVKFFKDQFINKIELIRSNKLSKDKIELIYRDLVNEIEETENEQLADLEEIFSAGLRKIKGSRVTLTSKDSSNKPQISDFAKLKPSASALLLASSIAEQGMFKSKPNAGNSTGTVFQSTRDKMALEAGVCEGAESLIGSAPNILKNEDEINLTHKNEKVQFEEERQIALIGFFKRYSNCVPKREINIFLKFEKDVQKYVSYIERPNFSDLKLSHEKMTPHNFKGARLHNSDFLRVDFTGGEFEGATFYKSNIGRAIFTDAKGLSVDALTEAFYIQVEAADELNRNIFEQVHRQKQNKNKEYKNQINQETSIEKLTKLLAIFEKRSKSYEVNSNNEMSQSVQSLSVGFRKT